MVWLQGEGGARQGEQCKEYCPCKGPFVRAKMIEKNILKMEAAGFSEMVNLSITLQSSDLV